MDFEVKFKSVAWKWILNVFFVLLAVIIVLEVMLCLFIRSYYTSRAQLAAEEYARVFVGPLENCSISEYQSTARQYCEEFEHKDKLEVQVLDSAGKVLFSTTGFVAEEGKMPDYELALQNGDEAYWIGNSEEGERLLCQTVILDSGDLPSNGAVRWVVSLIEVDRRILLTCLFGIGVGVLILLVTGLRKYDGNIRQDRHPDSAGVAEGCEADDQGAGRQG